ncbi:VOC family protein [Bradyrhizobium sp. AUGA SZCCT0222]|uniref:VOC family protein n=1 Tax=Bradyrhizobium sp. AUGA SZCCT0222 TaxID=2807668 RepID=UPI001BA79D28|nr:VOC family protein [Bradyrhizobium sp. AUGA SZCCT0222]MBR1270354.1 VOC family protein [Bradyrhizobium sp. AUGA SZCCT0222]
MIKVKRIRHATFATADIEQQIEYYQGIIGLGIVERQTGRALFASESGELTLVLEQDTASSCKAMAFEIGPDVELADVGKELNDLGIKSEIRSDSAPGIPRTLVFSDVDGRQVELFTQCQFTAPSEQVRGIVVSKLGHMAMYAPDPDRTARFYSDVLGFRDSDRIEENFVFMRCGFEHHAVNFARGTDARLHHMAFELRDASHMQQACDLLGRRKIPLLWGPVRHGPGHNIATYHRDPDGYLIELFYDMDRMADEELGYFEPRPWHRDRPQRPKTWIGLPRDIWGVGPAPDTAEFSPKMRGGK